MVKIVKPKIQCFFLLQTGGYIFYIRDGLNNVFLVPSKKEKTVTLWIVLSEHKTRKNTRYISESKCLDMIEKECLNIKQDNSANQI